MRDEDYAGYQTGSDINTDYRYSDGYIHAYDKRTGRDMGMTYDEKKRYNREHQKSHSEFKAGVIGGAVGAGISDVGSRYLGTGILAGIAGAGLAINLIFSVFTTYFVSYVITDWTGYFNTLGKNQLRILAIPLLTVLFYFTVRDLVKKHNAHCVRFFILCWLIMGFEESFLTFRRFIPERAILAFPFAVLPTIIFCFVQHLVTKKERNDKRSFLRRIAQGIIRGSERTARNLKKTGNYMLIGSGIMTFIAMALLDDPTGSLLKYGCGGIAIGVLLRIIAALG